MSVGTAGLAGAFARARAERRAALIAYVVAGDPDRAASLAILAELTAAGVDIIELGIPYSDPLADGPTITAAAGRAIAGGMTMRGALDLAAEATAAGAAPLVLFTYANPVDRYGAERFARDARAAGAAGALVPDVPLEECDAFAAPLRANGLDMPLLVAPTTPPARAAAIAAASSGFVYLVSRLGVTGARRAPDVAWAAATAGALRAATPLPIAVGFGISTTEHVAAVGAVADGVIVGSALIDAIAGQRGSAAASAAGTFARALRTALPVR